MILGCQPVNSSTIKLTVKQYILHFCIILAALLSCTGKTSDAAPPAEDTVAKQMLQGVWMSEDEVVTMRVAGDTISYSDSTMAPAYFAVVRDSLVIRGATEARYEILKQTEHIFEFRNHAGDIVKLLKSDNPDDAKAFTKHAAPPLNQNRLIKRDTVAIVADRKYHVYVQVKGEKGAFMKREVTLGQDNGERVEIVSGLKAGEQVVARGAYQVKLASASGIIPEGHNHQH